MTILVFGETGQLARALGERHDVVRIGRDRADLSRPQECIDIIAEFWPDAVINAAAFTAVDRAETEHAKAHQVNAVAPAAMARTCAMLDIPFVQLSTEYVFDGAGQGAFQPGQRPFALNAYGRSKLAGEVAVRGIGGRHAILRTSWVFSEHGDNFVTTILRLGRQRDRLNVVADQVGGPTAARDLAAACLSIAEQLSEWPNKSGTYHFAGGPDISRADFARAIFAEAGLPTRVTDVASADFISPAARPLNSRLDCTRTHEVFGLPRPDWRLALSRMLSATDRRLSA